MGDYYILDEDHNAIPVDDVLQWAKWFEANKDRRIVKQEDIAGHRVSTVFLGLDHNFMRHLTRRGRPLLFETLVFSDDFHDQERCPTWQEAERMHEKIAKRVKRRSKS